MTYYREAPTGLAYLEGGMVAERRWVVPVVRCEHREHDYPNGHIDGHFFYDWDSKEVPSAEWCPGAGIGDAE